MYCNSSWRQFPGPTTPVVPTLLLLLTVSQALARGCLDLAHLNLAQCHRLSHLSCLTACARLTHLDLRGLAQVRGGRVGWQWGGLHPSGLRLLSCPVSTALLLLLSCRGWVQQLLTGLD
jgi:hypothetical protein